MISARLPKVGDVILRSSRVEAASRAQKHRIPAGLEQ
jgi:hypothetical protein